MSLDADFTIKHHCETEIPPISGRVIQESSGLSIDLEGYGNIVYIEVDDNGHPVVYLWADATNDDITHRINLRGAHVGREPQNSVDEASEDWQTDPHWLEKQAEKMSPAARQAME